VSAFGLYVGVQGLFCVVQADDGRGLGGSYGRDGAGAFTDNMGDWRWYLGETDFEGEGYRDFPHQDSLVIIGHRGERLEEPFTDRSLFGAIAQIIRPVLAEYLPFAVLPRTSPFRVGIESIGGPGEYWLLRDQPDESRSTAFDRWVAEISA
jgi:hypothetical protein